MNMIHKIIYPCEKATRHLIESDDVKLTSLQKLRIRIHLIICKNCTRFNIQNKWMDKQIKKLSFESSNEKMEDCCKERIANALKKEINS